MQGKNQPEISLMVVTGNTKAGGQGGSLPKRITESAHVIAILVELNDFKSLNPLMCFSKSQSTFVKKKRQRIFGLQPPCQSSLQINPHQWDEYFLAI